MPITSEYFLPVGFKNAFKNAHTNIVVDGFYDWQWVDMWKVNDSQVVFHLLKNTEAVPQIGKIESNQLIRNVNSYVVIHVGKASCLEGWISYIDLTIF